MTRWLGVEEELDRQQDDQIEGLDQGRPCGQKGNPRNRSTTNNKVRGLLCVLLPKVCDA